MPDIGARGLFFCHKGMRRTVAMTHEPTGHRVEISQNHWYDATIHGGRPILANGDYAPLCAGFASTRGVSTADAHAKLAGDTP